MGWDSHCYYRGCISVSAMCLGAHGAGGARAVRGPSKIPKSSCPMTPCSQGLYPVVSIHTETRELRTQRVSERESHKKAAPGTGTTENHLHSKLSKRQAVTKSPFSACRPNRVRRAESSGAGGPAGKMEWQEVLPCRQSWA